MRFARIFQQYKYDGKTWNGDGNLGDCIQNLAVENLYKEMGIDNLLLINRDDIPNYKGEKALLPMQGWFGNVHNVFPVDFSANIYPVFIGFYLNDFNNNREKFIEKKIYEKMKPFEPIGCRNRNTRDFLKKLGLKAYFSGCLTLTFDKRKIEQKNGRVFLVDVTNDIKEKLPKHIINEAQEVTHNYVYKNYPVTKKEALEFENAARKLLEKYKNEAKLIVTPRIHCAMPAVAMGIPTILINKNTADCRLDVLDGIILKYSPDDIPTIDWNSKAPDIEDLKVLIKENAKNQILRKIDNDILEKLNKKTEELYILGKKFIPKIHRDFLEIIKTKEKIIFWGASLFLKEFIEKYNIKHENILAIVDKNPINFGKYFGRYQIQPIEKLKDLKPDVIICTIKNHHETIYPEIEKHLKENYPNINFEKDLFN